MLELYGSHHCSFKEKHYAQVVFQIDVSLTFMLPCMRPILISPFVVTKEDSKEYIAFTLIDSVAVKLTASPLIICAVNDLHLTVVEPSNNLLTVTSPAQKTDKGRLNYNRKCSILIT